MSGNILSVREEGLCIACGVCAGNCPKQCITMRRQGNEYLPEIDAKACISCGICMDVCPRGQLCSYDGTQSVETYLLGDCRQILCAKAKSEKIRAQATSGGVVTQLVAQLLETGEYDSAYLLSGYCYDTQLKSQRFQKGDSLRQTPKSRYLTVSHEDTVAHMIAHPEERSIFVGTGCAVQGILNTIERRHLQRDHYLLLGLFCDKTMHYGVVDYFAHHPCGKGRTLSEFYFRTKDAGGWPGNVRLCYTDGSQEDLINRERMQVKDYFMPERCLYCLDKLNRNCDIALGDNYIEDNADSRGVNSCIIRTSRGAEIWDRCEGLFDSHEDSAEHLSRSQHLDQKRKNLSFSCLKGLRPGGGKAMERRWKAALEKLALGKMPNPYPAVRRDVQRCGRRRKVKQAVTLPVRFLKRTLHK